MSIMTAIQIIIVTGWRHNGVRAGGLPQICCIPLSLLYSRSTYG